MDKETLSNYGWIVICVLVLAVMIALATPFGTFVADAVKSTTQGLFDVNQNALNSTGLINIDGQEFESCPHDYETTTTGDCATGTTSTHTCKLCGKTYTETTPAGHAWDNTGLTCNQCKTQYLEYDFLASDYDAKMGTTTATDATVVIPETFTYTDASGTTTHYKVTSINNKGFYECSNLISITIPSSVTSLGNNSFRGCSNLKHVSLPEGPMQYLSWTFLGCTSLEEIIIPEGTTQISGFVECSSLKTVYLPSTLSNMYSYTFRDCPVEMFHYAGTIEQWNAINKSSNWYDRVMGEMVESYTIRCTDGDINITT